MLTLIVKIFVISFFLNTSTHAFVIDFIHSSINQLPAEAVQLDNHRYFYIESSEIIPKKKHQQLHLKVCIGNNYNLSSSPTVTSQWMIGEHNYYLFTLQYKDRYIHSNSQFNVITLLKEITSVSIDLYFNIPIDFLHQDAVLFFTGNPRRISQKKGISLSTVNTNLP